MPAGAQTLAMLSRFRKQLEETAAPAPEDSRTEAVAAPVAASSAAAAASSAEPEAVCRLHSLVNWCVLCSKRAFDVPHKNDSRMLWMSVGPSPANRAETRLEKRRSWTTATG